MNLQISSFSADDARAEIETKWDGNTITWSEMEPLVDLDAAERFLEMTWTDQSYAVRYLHDNLVYWAIGKWVSE